MLVPLWCSGEAFNPFTTELKGSIRIDLDELNGEAFLIRWDPNSKAADLGASVEKVPCDNSRAPSRGSSPSTSPALQRRHPRSNSKSRDAKPTCQGALPKDRISTTAAKVPMGPLLTLDVVSHLETEEVSKRRLPHSTVTL